MVVWHPAVSDLKVFHTTHLFFRSRGLQPLALYFIMGITPPISSCPSTLPSHILVCSVDGFMLIARWLPPPGCNWPVFSLRNHCLAYRGQYAACVPVAPGFMHHAYYSRLCYAMLPGGLSSFGRRTHFECPNSPLVLRPWLMALGLALSHASYLSLFHCFLVYRQVCFSLVSVNCFQLIARWLPPPGCNWPRRLPIRASRCYKKTPCLRPCGHWHHASGLSRLFLLCNHAWWSGLLMAAN